MVVVYDVMQRALLDLKGIYMRAAIRAEEGSVERSWWHCQDYAVSKFLDSVNPRDREAMIEAHEWALAEIDHARDVTFER